MDKIISFIVLFLFCTFLACCGYKLGIWSADIINTNPTLWFLVPVGMYLLWDDFMKEQKEQKED